MKIAESKREGSDGITFYTRTWEPDAKAKAVVALIHGQVMIHAGVAIHGSAWTYSFLRRFDG